MIELKNVSLSFGDIKALDGVSLDICKGDVIVMVSDGTCALRDDPIVDALKRFDGGSAQTLAESILRSTRKNLQKNKEDDSTVLAIVVE